MQYREIKVTLPKSRTDELYEVLDELQVAGYYEVLFDGEADRSDPEEIISDITTIRIYLHTDELEKELKILIFLKLKEPEAVFWEIREIETRDYEEAYKEFYKPFPIGKRLWVVPVWEKEEFLNSLKTKQLPNSTEKSDSKDSFPLPLFINPGVAFGTGHHETTKLILERLDELSDEGLSFARVCDLGTGSGILSVGLGKLGSQKIFALDIDPNAVRASWDNWQSNDFGREISFQVQESGLDNPELLSKEFDLAIANITFAVLSNNIQWLAKVKSPRYIFSGIITEKKDAFLALLQSHIPGSVVAQKEWNEWWMIDWIRV